MATLDDSPSVYSGQSWAVWAENVPLEDDNDGEERVGPRKKKDNSSSMKLLKEDMSLFGFCPSQDEIYLVVCEKCGQVIKPQALKRHLEERHGSKECSSGRSSLSSRTHTSTSRGSYSDSFSSQQSAFATKSSVKQTPNLAQSSSPKMGSGKVNSMNKIGKKNHNLPNLPALEVSLQRIPADLKTVSLHSEPVKSQNSPKASPAGSSNSLATNPVSNGTVKSATNSTTTTPTSSTPSPLGTSSTSAVHPPSPTNSASPINQSSPKALSAPSISPVISLPTETAMTITVPGTSVRNSPIMVRSPPSLTKCSTVPERSPGKGSTLLSTMSSVKSFQLTASKSPSSCTTMKNSPTASGSMAKSSSSAQVTKSSTSMPKLSLSPLKSSASPPKSSTSPSKSSTSPSKSSTSPCRSNSSSTSPCKASASPKGSSSSTPGKSAKPKERKFLPCKEREFDANIHCGVKRPEDERQCTRSLTCKTHALSLRRAVEGRRKPFDELLKDHRAAKEALLKLKIESKQAALLAAGETVSGPGGTTLATLMLSENSSEPMQINHSHEITTSAIKLELGLSSPKTGLSQNANTTKPKPLKPANTVFKRSNSSGLQSPPRALKEELSPLSEVFSRLSSDGELDLEEVGQERGDAPYLTHHPRPIGMCTFGGRYASGGYYLFSRKTDYLRSAFLSALERHLHPPPHKKLCVESNLPKEPQLLTNSKDPYEFTLMDASMGGFSTPPALLNTLYKPASKQKNKPVIARTLKGKGDNSGQQRPPNQSVCSTSPTGGSSVVLKRKRSSGSMGSPGSAANMTNVTMTSGVQIGSLSLATGHVTSSNPIIAIPNVNLSTSTLSHFNANVPSVGGGKTVGHQLHKNNINLKDIGIVVTGMEPGNMVNGQLLNLTAGANIVDFSAGQFSTHIAEKGGSSKRSRSGGGSGGHKHNSSRQISMSNIEGLCSLSNNIMATLPQNTFFVDNSMLASAALSSLPPSSVISLANSSPPQASPSTTPSPFIRSGSVSPQVSAASPVPNGVISSPSGVSFKAISVTALNHMTSTIASSPSASRNSTPSPSPNFTALDLSPSHTSQFTIPGNTHQQISGSHKHSSRSQGSQRTLTQTGIALPPGTLTLSGAQQGGLQLQNTFHNLCVANNALPGSMAVKQTGVSLAKNLSVSKQLPLSAVSFTIPFMAPPVSMSNQQPTTTLFVTSDEPPKSETLQIKQTSSSHRNVIS